ncbi:putative receptor-like serine/threonine-protein kinase [Platanthera guangdongensis]|uniref:Receptor-like serine/threonine-protein kinase n=1 Tax=Platanthera guangdongensis TaxID=2320717 RepID=A0ABR2MP92_9ASPA
MVVQKRVFEAEEVKRRCILVGLQLNGEQRELLSWALANVAKEGDRLIAVRVSRNPQDTDRGQTSSLLKILDDFMADHENICAKKQVILAGRVAWGSSIKRILVKEAEFCGAHTVIVGASNNYSFGGSASLAKYCAKKLPSTVSLIAVHKGEIILEREATNNSKPISGEQHKPNLRSFLHPSIGMDTNHIARGSCHRLTCEKKKKFAKESKDYCLLLPDRASKKPGWPLLRKEAAGNIEASKHIEERKLSVVQWAMKLPNRSSASIPTGVEMVKQLETILGINSAACRFFHYEELQISTNCFSSENLIGKGGNSQVYSGRLPNGEQVAVKVSYLSEKSSKDFLLEMDIITRIRHDGVMPLIGVCVKDSNLIPVYSYFPRGSLEENLHCHQSSKSPLGWEKRFKVAVGVAEALNYLHYGCSKPVIHRDVKSSNILLTDECKAKLSDFGLAIWAPTASPCLTHSDVVGTFGYLAPEYFMYGKVDVKIDVYAFGVVLLELLTGRKPISDDSPKGQESLVMWATPILERGDYMELLDPKLDGKYEEHWIKRMVCAASLCIRREARRRPQMNQILELLQGEQEIEQWMSLKVNNNVTEEDEEVYPASSIGSHMGLALLDVDDDASVMSFEQNYLNSLDEYLQNRWSRSSSFD